MFFYLYYVHSKIPITFFLRNRGLVGYMHIENTFQFIFKSEIFYTHLIKKDMLLAKSVAYANYRISP